MSGFSFLYVTDTHIGNDGTGWGHHPIRPDLVPVLVEALGRWIEEHPVQMLLHGGDMTDNGTAEQRARARQIWSQLPVPTRLCLGNHDMADRQAYNEWLREQPQFFPDGKADYVIGCGPVDVYVVTCAWPGENGELSRWWNRTFQDRPGILPDQVRWLEETLSARSDRPAILAVHAPLDPLPPELTGLPQPSHVPPGEFVDVLSGILDRHRNIKLVLSGHCHATCLTDHRGTVHLTTSAFCEPPFQVRRISISKDSIQVQTFCPVDYKRLQAVFRAENAWSAGRDGDLAVEIPFDGPVLTETEGQER